MYLASEIGFVVEEASETERRLNTESVIEAFDAIADDAGDAQLMQRGQKQPRAKAAVGSQQPGARRAGAVDAREQFVQEALEAARGVRGALPEPDV